MDHAELQDPSYHPVDALHLPFQTGPLPLEIGGEVPYEGLRQGLFHQEVRSSGVEVGVESGAALPPGLSESKESGATAAAAAAGSAAAAAAAAAAADAAPRLDRLEKSINSRDLLSDQQRQQQQQDGGGGAENGATSGAASSAGGGGGGGDTNDAASAAAHGMQKSSSLTAKVFAAARADRGSSGSGSGARFSAASATGTAFSGGGGDRASPENLSPTSNATSTDALPVRELVGRRQGDSSHLQKLFRTADDGHGGSSSQPTSPHRKDEKGPGGSVGSRRNSRIESGGSGADQGGKIEPRDKEANPSNGDERKEAPVAEPGVPPPSK